MREFFIIEDDNEYKVGYKVEGPNTIIKIVPVNFGSGPNGRANVGLFKKALEDQATRIAPKAPELERLLDEEDEVITKSKNTLKTPFTDTVLTFKETDNGTS
jgi:hypothetical protein